MTEWIASSQPNNWERHSDALNFKIRAFIITIILVILITIIIIIMEVITPASSMNEHEPGPSRGENLLCGPQRHKLDGGEGLLAKVVLHYIFKVVSIVSNLKVVSIVSIFLVVSKYPIIVSNQSGLLILRYRGAPCQGDLAFNFVWK